MAKDPAFLFYPNDFLSGTMTFTDAHIGAYVRLLIAQFNQGPLSVSDVKEILKTNFWMWDTKLESKFSEQDGLYFNPRLKLEMDKRSSYSNSRRKNRNSTTYVRHMEDENENEIINKNELPVWLNLKAWNAWEEYKKEKKQKLTPSTIKFQLKFLEKHQKDHTQIIKNSIQNGWTGFFALKENLKGNGDHTRAYQKRIEEDKESRERTENEKNNSNLRMLSEQSKSLVGKMEITL